MWSTLREVDDACTQELVSFFVGIPSQYTAALPQTKINICSPELDIDIGPYVRLDIARSSSTRPPLQNDGVLFQSNHDRRVNQVHSDSRISGDCFLPHPRKHCTLDSLTPATFLCSVAKPTSLLFQPTPNTSSSHPQDLHSSSSGLFPSSVSPVLT